MGARELPQFIASNMTDHEFLVMLDDSSAPRYLVERFKEMLGMREELAASEADINNREEKADDTVIDARDKCETLRERWDELCEKNPMWYAATHENNNGKTPEEVALVELSLDALEEILQ